jgi:hypothetical protein
MLNRRQFVTLAAGAALGKTRDIDCDVAVIGGSTGGCAAALAAARNGLRVVLTEETEWLGGQLTSQAVPPDEHPWIESFGATETYRAYRRAVRDYYRAHYPLTEAARARIHLNPGDGSVSRLTHEPRVSLAVIEAMLAPYASGGRLLVLRGCRPVAADVDGDRVRAVSVAHGETITIRARYFLDATEQGDLLPLARAEFVTGAESGRDTGEPHAPAQARPQNMQAFTCCFAVEYAAGEDHAIDRPEEYAFWRDYVPRLEPAWPGRLLSWTTTHPVTLAPRTMSFDPTPGARAAGNLWLYRRIANQANFAPGAYRGDITLVNWPQNDYWLGNLHGVAPEEAARHLARAKQLSLSLLYWMQTEAPRPDGGQGWKGLRLRPDLVGTEDGLAMYPYIRESRRIRAEFTVVEQHVGTEPVADSVGVGSYRIDLHPSSGGDNYIDVSSLPFQIPLGALIPRRIENLLAACKNLGVTHITNGCYRLHPVEWNIGEAAGLAAVEAIRTGEPPRKIRSTPRLLREFQARIQAQGVETAWPRITAR